jgi:uncharacterized DUF497 family protein
VSDVVSFDVFDWDETNLEHATRHGISREQIESAAKTGLAVHAAYVRGNEWRYGSVGRTHDGILIDIAFTIRGESFRPITAHKLKRQKRKLYESI